MTGVCIVNSESIFKQISGFEKYFFELAQTQLPFILEHQWHSAYRDCEILSAWRNKLFRSFRKWFELSDDI